MQGKRSRSVSTRVIGNRMRPVPLVGALTGLLTLGTAAFAIGSGWLPQPPKAQTPLEERGRHVLQIAGGCGCHGTNFAGWKAGTPDSYPRAAPFGERFVGSFGSVPASNITPDSNTGISGWSDADMEKALTEGIDPAGDMLAPQMPYRAYHGMAKEDIRALIAYLRRLRPVTNAVPEKVLKTPTPALEALPTSPETPPTEPVAEGRYLVEHVAGCTDCHASGTTGPAGELLTGKWLPIGGDRALAPNLTSDRKYGIGRWSQADIARYLRTGTRPDGGLAQSAMAGIILTSFSHFTPAEAAAIAAYLKTLPPIRKQADCSTPVTDRLPHAE